MDLTRAVQKRVEPYPLVYRVLLFVYGVFGEIRFLVHAVVSGKLRERLARSAWERVLSRQGITYRETGANAGSLNGFRRWLDDQGLRFLEGGWTIYIPPQDGLENSFGFLRDQYPPNAGLKILKNFQGPEKARYTPHRQHPAPGVAIMRSLTPSAVALIRIANYLYRKGLGIRIYDITGLRCNKGTLTCYVVEGVDGRVTNERDYKIFMDRMQSVLEEGDLTTAHARVDIIEDLMPLDCNANLRLRSADGVPLYVDFQGFLFRNEDRMIERVFTGAKPHVRFNIDEIGKGRDPVWEVYRRVLVNAGCGLEGRLVMEVGCSPSFVAYEALCAGASWVIGWYPPLVRRHMERLLLTVGATRFDLFEEDRANRKQGPAEDIPGRYRGTKGGLLFLAAREQDGAGSCSIEELYGELPWEYVLCGEGFEFSGAELLSEGHWVEPDGSRGHARVFRRPGKGMNSTVE